MELDSLAETLKLTYLPVALSYLFRLLTLLSLLGLYHILLPSRASSCSLLKNTIETQSPGASSPAKSLYPSCALLLRRQYRVEVTKGDSLSRNYGKRPGGLIFVGFPCGQW